MNQRIAGRRTPNAVPVMVDAFVEASGPNAETAVVHHQYVVVIPAAIFTRNR